MLNFIKGIRDEEFSLAKSPTEIPSDDEIYLYEDDKDSVTVINDSNVKNSVPVADSIPVSNIIQVVTDVIYTQRTIEDRVSNPHGEHAEDVWIIKKSVLRSIILSRNSISQTANKDPDDVEMILNRGSCH